MSLRTFATTLVLTAALSGLPPSQVAAQTSARTAAPTPAAPAPAQDLSSFDRQNAQETRQRLHEVLRDYPPSLAQVLRMDPTLLTNQAYLAPYPMLAAFLAQHPAVAHNPAFFLGSASFLTEEDGRRRTISDLEDIAIGVGLFLFFMTALGVTVHISRSVLEHRRWQQAMKVQTDAHTKLVDRLASNEDLLAYIQSPAGMRFLSATSTAAEIEPRLASTPAPVGRILIAKNRVIEEVAQPLHIIAVLALALGVGFVVSALLSYALSRQLGLIRPTSSNA
jgi:hypothetical protein